MPLDPSISSALVLAVLTIVASIVYVLVKKKQEDAEGGE